MCKAQIMKQMRSVNLIQALDIIITVTICYYLLLMISFWISEKASKSVAQVSLEILTSSTQWEVPGRSKNMVLG